MTSCELRDTADIELYFYGEFDPVDRARVESHLRGCEACRMRLEDLRAIRRALSSCPAVDAPPAGDWSGFMRRLDSAIAREAPRPGSGQAEPSKVTTFEPRNLESAASWNLRYVLVIAATLALVTIGVLMAMRFEPAAEISVAVKTPVTAPVTDSTLVTSQVRSPQVDRALRESSAEHLERSKLVVLGLASKEPGEVSVADWAYERSLASSLLSDTRLYRLAAEERGLTSLAGVMRDLELVLLETSMAEGSDPAELPQIQRLIRKRQLIQKMDVVNTVGLVP